MNEDLIWFTLHFDPITGRFGAALVKGEREKFVCGKTVNDLFTNISHAHEDENGWEGIW